MYTQWSITKHTYKRTRRFFFCTHDWPFDHFQYCLIHSINANIELRTQRIKKTYIFFSYK
jgi:hypothetical protein